MFAPETAIALTLLLPLAGAVLIGLLGGQPNLREGATLLTAGALFFVVIQLFGMVAAGAAPALTVWDVIPGLPIAFKIEPLGMLFGAIASGLWIVNSLYSIGYMRG
ncbi:MAG: monovalent cation/H+ antiporter subunit D family protein, partial [Pseudomonadota bacterium]